jgi:pilus assembly protein Flp/PilA
MLLLEFIVKLQNRLAEVRDNERGATAVEYGIMVALIAAVIIVVVAAIGQKILAAFNLVDTNLP